MEFQLPTIEALEGVAPELLRALGSRRKIALYGEMGAGKTTLVNALCRVLGVTQHTASPTFSLVNEYGYTDASGDPALIHHLDLYRLRTLEEALDIGLEDLLYDPWYCLIEWPQLVLPILPADAAHLHIEITGLTSRTILLT